MPGLARVMGALNRMPDGFLQTLGGVTAIHVDGDAGAGGDGSLADPYDDFTEVNTAAAAGELDGLKVRLNRGSTIYDQLVLTGTIGVTIEPYGSGADPIIDVSTVLAGAWTKVGNVYSHASETVIRNLLVDGTKMTIRKAGQSGSGAAANALAADNAAYVEAGPVLTVYSSTLDMTTATDIRHATVEFGIDARTGVNGCTIRNITVQMAKQNCVVFNGDSNNNLITGCTIRWCGDDGDVGSGIFMSGASKADKATGNIFENCKSYGHNVLTGTQGNAIEISWQDGMIIRDCEFYDIAGNGIEVYDECDNCLIENCLVYCCYANAVKIYTTASEAADSTNNLFRNCVFHSDNNWFRDNNPIGAQLVDYRGGTNNRFTHCSFFGDNAHAFWVWAGTAVYKNNVGHLLHTGGTNYQHIYLGALTQLAVMVGSDYNVYDYTTGGQSWYQDGITYYTGANWALWKALNVDIDDNSVSSNGALLYTAAETSFHNPETDPPDMSIGGGSNAEDFSPVDSDSPSTDINGVVRVPAAGFIDAGAYIKA